jgi:hypothetical protein
VPTPEDERFERYLKQFRPLPPETLQIEKHERATRLPFVFAKWTAVAAAAAAMLIAAVLTNQSRLKPTHSPSGTGSPATVERLTSLTIGSANGLLARAPSVKAAVDQVAFRSQTTPLSKGTQSALAVLSKENIKL